MRRMFGEPECWNDGMMIFREGVPASVCRITPHILIVVVRVKPVDGNPSEDHFTPESLDVAAMVMEKSETLVKYHAGIGPLPLGINLDCLG
jgi:hypothetical protein